ncbi:MAG: RND transporter, partial [Burkholderia sp.]|nr:RND transporter [Burkholderia sp.]
MMRHLAQTRVACIAVAAILLAGCTTFSNDGGFGAVSTTASQRLGKDAVYVKTDEDREAVFKRTRELLSKPLGMDDAVQLALLNNRGLQAAYGELGVSEADLVQAG